MRQQILLRQPLNMIRAFTLSLLLCFPLLANAVRCDSFENENFLTYFFRFASDKAFATSRTIYPLKVLAQKYGIDEMGSDLSSVTRLLRSKRQDAELPSLSSTLQEGNLIARVHEKSDNSTVVQIFGQNSEWGQTYHFSRKGKCWFLREFREHSISDRHWVEQQEYAPRSELVPHFYIKPDNQPLRAILRVLNHLAFIHESVALGDFEDAQAELNSLCENLEANTDYAIEDSVEIIPQLREALSLFSKGGEIEGSVLLGNVSRALWARID